MSSPERDYFRPLCPWHYGVMAICATVGHPPLMDTTTVQHCECRVPGCNQNYSPGLGYFTVAQNDDYWHATGSSSVKMIRSPKQAICGEHKDAMFLESFDPGTNLENFRCPREACHQTIQVLAGAPPTYWLGSGYFSSQDRK